MRMRRKLRKDYVTLTRETRLPLFSLTISSTFLSIGGENKVYVFIKGYHQYTKKVNHGLLPSKYGEENLHAAFS